MDSSVSDRWHFHKFSLMIPAITIGARMLRKVHVDDLLFTFVGNSDGKGSSSGKVAHNGTTVHCPGIVSSPHRTPNPKTQNLKPKTLCLKPTPP